MSIFVWSLANKRQLIKIKFEQVTVHLARLLPVSSQQHPAPLQAHCSDGSLMSAMRGADGNAKDPHSESVPFGLFIHSYVGLSELSWALLLEESLIKSIIGHSKRVLHVEHETSMWPVVCRVQAQHQSLDVKSSRCVFRVMNKSSAVTCKVCFHRSTGKMNCV